MHRPIHRLLLAVSVTILIGIVALSLLDLAPQGDPAPADAKTPPPGASARELQVAPPGPAASVRSGPASVATARAAASTTLGVLSDDDRDPREGDASDPWSDHHPLSEARHLDGGDTLRVRRFRLPESQRQVLVVDRQGGATAHEPQARIRRLEIAADHLIIRLAAGADPVALDAMLAAHGARVESRWGGDWASVSFPARDLVALEELSAALRAAAAVHAVQPDHLYRITAIPDSPDWQRNWGLHDTADKDIDAPAAWDSATGDSGVVVAVVDTGIDLDHPELSANLWTNPGESGPDGAGGDRSDNGIDDDGNGFVDDVHGWNFTDRYGVRGPDPDDDHGHGTHCAGIIGADGTDGSGIAGVNWRCGLMAVKVLNSSGAGFDSWIAPGLAYARDQGARIANNSYGSAGRSETIGAQVAELIAAGCLFVAAAGNDARDLDGHGFYPASFDGTLSVASIDHDAALSSFSNYGAVEVDLAAPGRSIYSTLPGGYGLRSGTSMAAPFAAGVGALLLDLDASFSGEDLRSLILATARSEPQLDGLVATGGRLNAAAALDRVTNPWYEATLAAIWDNGSYGSDGDGDGIANPGETIVAELVVTNRSPSPDPAAVLGLSAPNPLVATLDPTLELGAVAGWQQLIVRVRLALDPDLPQAGVALIWDLPSGAPGGRSGELRIPIYHAAVLSGHVLDLLEEPIANATVTLAAPEPVGTLTALTGADGGYAFDSVNGPHRLSATAPSYSPSPIIDLDLSTAAVRNVVLGRAVLVVDPGALEVVDADGPVVRDLTMRNTGDVPVIANWAASAEAGSDDDLLLLESEPRSVVDGFEDGDSAGWVQIEGVDPVIEPSGPVGQRSLALRPTGYGHRTGLRRDFAADTRPARVSLRWQVGSTTDWLGYVSLWSGELPVIELFGDRGHISCNDNVWTGGRDDIPYAANQWYHLELRDIDWDAGRFDLYVDGKLRRSQVPIRYPDEARGIDALHLYGQSRTGESRYDQIVVGGDWLSVPVRSATIDPGEELVVPVTLEPAGLTATTHRSTIVIHHNAVEPSGPLVVPVSLTPRERPALTVAGLLGFGTILVRTEHNLPLTLVNTGNVTLTVTPAIGGDPEFTLTDAGAMIIPPFHRSSLDLSYAPLAIGNHAATLQLDAGAAGIQPVAITGTAVIGAPDRLVVDAQRGPFSLGADIPLTVRTVDAAGNPVTTFDGLAQIQLRAHPARCPLRISEVVVSPNDAIEVQNYADRELSTAGWRVVVNEGRSASFYLNTPELRQWFLPASVPARGTLYATEDASDPEHYLGGYWAWVTDARGWVLLLDQGLRVMDFVSWGYTAEQLGGLTIPVGPRLITAADLPHHPAPAGPGAGATALSRRSLDPGSSQAFTWGSSSIGVPNPGLAIPSHRTASPLGEPVVIALVDGRWSAQLSATATTPRCVAQARLVGSDLVGWSQPFPIIAPDAPAPDAVDDDYRMRWGGELTVGAAEGVLANDAGAAITARAVSAPAPGRLLLEPDGGFRLSLAPGQEGPVTFRYRAEAGATWDEAEVTIQVDPPLINNPPDLDLGQPWIGKAFRTPGTNWRADILGDLFVVGGYGYAQIYRVGEDGRPALLQQLHTPPGRDSSGWFGFDVALQPGTLRLAVGSLFERRDGLQVGAVHIYDHHDGSWSVSQFIQPDGLADLSRFGSTLVWNGDELLIAERTAPGGGRIHVYRDSSGTLLPVDLLRHPRGSDDDRAGHSLATDGRWLVAGGYQGDGLRYGAGAVYSWRRDGDHWLADRLFVPDDLPMNSQYGMTMDLSPGRLAVGVRNHSSSRGKIYEWRWDGGQWLAGSIEPLQEPNPSETYGDALGSGIALGGDLLAALAPWDDDIGTDTGRVDLFRADGAGWRSEAVLLPTTEGFDGPLGVAPDLAGATSDMATDGNMVLVQGPSRHWYLFRRDDPRVTEYSAIGTEVCRIHGRDPDQDPLSYTLLDDAGGRFAIALDPPRLITTGAPLVDHDEGSILAVTIEATDGRDGRSRRFRIVVDDLPVLAPTSLGLERSGTDLVLRWQDPNPGPTVGVVMKRSRSLRDDRTWNSWTQFARVPAGTRSVVDRAIDVDAEHQYQVVADDDGTLSDPSPTARYAPNRRRIVVGTTVDEPQLLRIDPPGEEQVRPAGDSAAFDPLHRGDDHRVTFGPAGDG